MLSKPRILSLFHNSFKGLVNLQKTFYKLLLIEKPVMRETECRKLHQKIPNHDQVMKVAKFNYENMRKAHMTSFELFEILNLIYFIYFNII